MAAVSAWMAGCCALGVVVGCEQEDVNRKYANESVLEFFAPPTPQDAVAWAVDPYDADKRYRGLLLLANAPFGGEGPYVEMYELATGDSDPGVRAMAIRALAMHGSVRHADIALEHLTEKNSLVRWESARALQRFYAPQAVPALLERLDPVKEDDAQVRASAATALGQYDEPRVVQGLITAINDTQLTVNENARESLVTLTGEDFGYDGRAWLSWTRQTGDMFAKRREYVYPVFSRDKNIVEILLPFWQPPNEVAARPIGAPAPQTPGVTEEGAAGVDAPEPAGSRGG